MFNFFKVKEIDKNLDLAERIFNYRTYQPYVNNCPDKEVKEICKDCKNIQDSLNKVIEYCGEPNTPKARYYYAITYAWSRIEYNELAIKYLKLYLSNELYLPHKNKIFHLYEMNDYLGQAYEKGKYLDKALKQYEKCLNIYPQSQIPYLRIANIYRKMNELNKSIDILDKSKSTIYYKENKEFKEIIDRYYDDYQEKIKKGYIYKSRK